MVGKNGDVFQVDTVYRVTEAGREKVGFVNRTKFARFACNKRMTDDALDALIVEINEARAKQGRFGPVTHPRMMPPTDAALAEYIAETQDEEEDDDSDD
jgi:hypothetical protein